MVERLSPRILILEDEKNVGVTLKERLEQEHFEVIWAQSCAEASEALQTGRRFDLALLDVMLPDGSGFMIADELKKRAPATAIVFLTALGNPEDRVKGLEIGAEDYVLKPFHFKELLLRIQNALRRARFVTEVPQESFEGANLGRAQVFFTRFEIHREGEIHSLTHKECALLKLLFERKGRVVSRDEILAQIWSVDEFPSPRTIDNFVMKLRRLIELDANKPEIIRSIRGVGYQLL